MEGNFPNNTYNRMSSFVVKRNQYDGFLLRSSSTYNGFNLEKNQTIHIIGPVRIIGT